MAALSPFDVAIQGLEQEHNITRIKKLLVYLSRSVWESDSMRLNAYNLAELVTDTLQVAPTLDHLKQHLGRVVHSLNKSAEYMLVARAIVNHIRPLYNEHLQPTQIVYDSNTYRTIAHALEQDAESLRIKKLLFCACSGSWENDADRLKQYSTVSLIQQLYELAPTPEALQNALTSIVQTLNRQAEYTLLADRIVLAFQPLYPQTEHTQIIPPTHPPSLPLPPHSLKTQNSKLKTPPPPTLHSHSTSLTASPPPTPARLTLTPEAHSSTPHSLTPHSPLPTPPDLFDIRLEIMKYTAPMRAKVLMFSLLYYPLVNEDANWSILKTHDLDELLQSLLQKFSTSQNLETALKQMVHMLPDSDQYGQAAIAIQRAVRPYYTYREKVDAIAPVESALPTKRTPVVEADQTCSLQFSEAASSSDSSNSDGEYTVPLLPPVSGRSLPGSPTSLRP